MADTKTSDELDAGTLAGTELVRLVTGAAGSYADKRTTTQAIANLAAVTSAKLDAILGSTRGAVAIRGAAGWTVLAPGTSGNILTSNGAGADPTYQAPASPVAYHPGFQSGRLYTRRLVQSIANATVSANRIYTFPFFVPSSTTFTKIALWVGTGVAASTAEVGIYNNSNGLPTTLNSYLGQLSTATSAALASLTGLSVTLAAGWYWPCVHFSGAPSIRSSAGADYTNEDLLGFDSTGGLPIQGFYGSQTYSAGSLPSNFPTGANLVTLSTNTIPLVYLGN